MKTSKILLVATMALLTGYVSAQTADEIISKYIDAIGGKEKLASVTSMLTEATLDVMGSQGIVKTTLLVGKGAKSEIDVMGTQVTMCITDTAGWTINPMGGIYSAQNMSPAEYNAGKDQLNIAGPFVDYAAKGYTVELVGQETVGITTANKIAVTTPDNMVTNYFFDPATNLLIKTVQMTEMMGQQMEISVNYSNYQATEAGVLIPFGSETSYGGQFFLVANINKVEVNQPVDPAVFAKP
jgi:hypothetical protein